MADIEEIKSIAQQLWPNAEHIDIAPGAAGHTGFNDPDPQGLRLVATHADGSILGQEIAADLEELEQKLMDRLRSKAKL
jgi:hypothetical protein